MRSGIRGVKILQSATRSIENPTRRTEGSMPEEWKTAEHALEY